MELRALLCWASLATALEGEFPWGCPPFLGVPKVVPQSAEAGLSLSQLRHPLNTSDQ